ncbi:hypothetical protein Q3G72_005926 [Acer saccharum]|nr:hypothetical protein Q3G72_005926 [Acer saccharum]
MVWFWPNTDPEYKDIITKKKPAFIPELDDPSFSKVFLTRDIPCGYEILIENIMDPAHVPYSHYGIFQIDQPPEDINGFLGNHVWDDAKFVAPCIFYTYTNPIAFQSKGFAFSAAASKERKVVEVGFANWLKTCFINQIRCFCGWYWSHVVNCKSCHSAYKSLNALEVILQVISIVSVGIVAATRHSVIMSTTGRITVVSMAAVCFAASRWLARYIYKNFHCHDYDHTLH